MGTLRKQYNHLWITRLIVQTTEKGQKWKTITVIHEIKFLKTNAFLQEVRLSSHTVYFHMFNSILNKKLATLSNNLQ